MRLLYPPLGDHSVCVSMSRRPSPDASHSPTALAVVLRFIQLTLSASSTLPLPLADALPVAAKVDGRRLRKDSGELAEPDAARQHRRRFRLDIAVGGNTSRWGERCTCTMAISRNTVLFVVEISADLGD